LAIPAVESFLKSITGRGLCLQAGGAHGAYPVALAEHFDQVVTIEANPANYRILERVVGPITNIKPIHAALWNGHERVGTAKFRPQNDLTYYITPGDEVDTITIDELDLAPDLIWLDIEGSEFKALSGAKRTLERCDAVIIEEAGKGLEQNVGNLPGEARQLLEALGFKRRYTIHLDTLYLR
jgi:FkbM family methyltransferase